MGQYRGFMKGEPRVEPSQITNIFVSKRQFSQLLGPVLTFVHSQGVTVNDEQNHFIANELIKLVGMEESLEQKINRVLLPFQRRKVYTAVAQRNTVAFRLRS